VRRALLLPGPMNTRRVRRTKPPAAAPHHPGRRAFLIACIALPLVMIVPGALYVARETKPRLDDIESAIRAYGFDPLVPPSRLREPGAIYQVEGSSFRKVCDVHPELLIDKVRESPTQDRMRRRLEKGRFSLGGGVVEALNGKLEGGRVTTIEYRLKNVTIREIAMAALGEIEDALLREKHCDEFVNDLLNANKKVCSGSATLSATLSYKVHFDVRFDTHAKAKVADIVQKVIEEETGSRIQMQAADEFAGENLYYGIQLSTRCITAGTATEPSIRPRPPGSPQLSSLHDELF
jgi:hypothetical protein